MLLAIGCILLICCIVAIIYGDVTGVWWPFYIVVLGLMGLAMGRIVWLSGIMS